MGPTSQTSDSVQLAVLGKSSTRSKDDSISQSWCECETTPFVNTVGAHYVASRAHIEQACDSLRSQGQSITTHVGLSKGDVHPVEESHQSSVKALLEHVNETWSTMVMRTRPFSDDLFQHIHPSHQVFLSCKPHRPGCRRPMQQDIMPTSRSSSPT